MKEIEIKLFGAFRKYVPTGNFKLKVDRQYTAFELKNKIHEALEREIPEFSAYRLVFESALANETEVFTDEAKIEDYCNLALLPPVCGG